MAHPKKQGQNLLQEVNDLDSFSDSSSDISSDSSNDLAAYREFIEEKKPSLSKVEEAVDRVLTPSSPKDWHEIRFFARINHSVKEKFRKFQKESTLVTLKKEGKRGSGNAVGIAWDKKLSDYIESLKQQNLKFSKMEDHKEDVEFYLLQEIFKAFRIHLLDGHYPLYGYASDETDARPQVYFWHGEADAIGWYKDDKGEERYVIVDWKVLDIVEFWEKNKDAFGKYLHQCLIYARLLKLHMDLDYLPHILIVPISSINGTDIHPALFWDYPKECKEAIESFKWSVELPKPTMKVRGGLFLKKGRVKRSSSLHFIIDGNASVGELLDALGLASLDLEVTHLN